MAFNSFDANSRSAFPQQIPQDQQASIAFIQNLRMQSVKIKEMIEQIQRLKCSIQIKDREICYLKKKQSQSKFQFIKMEQSLNQNFIQKLKLAQSRIQQLQMSKIDLQNCIAILKSSQNSQKFGFRGLKNLHEDQLQRMKLEKQDLIKQTQKWKDKYSNCRDQCIILRQELQYQRKQSIQLKYLLKEKTAKQELLIKEASNKWKQLQKQMIKVKEQKSFAELHCTKLQQYIYVMEGEVSSQIGQYELQMKGILEQVASISDKGIFWKQKYCQLEILVNHIESLRNQWRSSKQTLQISKKSGSKVRKNWCQKPEKDILYQQGEQQKLQNSPATIKIRSK